jgi:hypothetical protein
MSIQRRHVVTLAALATAASLSSRTTPAAEPAAAGRLPATNPLHRFIGSWRGQVTVETGSGQTSTHTQQNRFAWTLGGVFLEERGSGSDGSSFAGLWAFDAGTGVYLAHYFLAPAGNVVALHHTWVEAKQSFVGTAELGGGVRMLSEDHFVSADAYDWTITVQDAQGALLSRTRGRQRRVRR